MVEDEKLLEHLDERITKFRGNLQELENAIGMWVVGRRFGWKVLYLAHDRKTIAKYEKILGVKMRDEVPDEGDLADKSVGLKLARAVSNFWKAVKGEIQGIRSGLIE